MPLRDRDEAQLKQREKWGAVVLTRSPSTTVSPAASWDLQWANRKWDEKDWKEDGRAPKTSPTTCSTATATATTGS